MRYIVSLIVCITAFTTPPTNAGTIILDAIDRGWYANDGGHLPSNLSYFVGNSTTGFIFRNWFVFDLTGIDQPIVSAELHLWNFSYFSVDPTETYTIFDVSTNLPDLVGGTGGIPAFNDLGSGSIYGSYLASDADDNSFLDIPLNGAALVSLNETAGQWATGGAFTTLDNDFGTLEQMFAGTGNLPLNFTQLIVTPIPAPAALPLLLMPALFGRRRRS